MSSVLGELPLSYAVLSERRRCGSASAVHEPSPVELLGAERDWQPPRPRVAHDQIVGLRVAFADAAVRHRVKQAGGTWSPERRVWPVRHDRVVALGLNGRIVDEPASTSGCQGSRDSFRGPS